nr:MAG TPA: hypothetical protein [Caudoviricetes sp.]
MELYVNIIINHIILIRKKKYKINVNLLSICCRIEKL